MESESDPTKVGCDSSALRNMARSYQTELFNRARSENLIVSLGTGTGKTYVAVLLIDDYSAATRLPLANGGKRSFFIVNTVSLVRQQGDLIERLTPLKVAKLYGSLQVDRWKKDKWDRETESHNVLVMTGEIFYRMLEHNYWRIQDTNVLVLDECHHVLGLKHPYRKIVRDYCKSANVRILGLTASVLHNPRSKARERLCEDINVLQNLSGCKVVSASCPSLPMFSKRCTVTVIEYPKEDPSCSQDLLLREKLAFLKKFDLKEADDLTAATVKATMQAFEQCISVHQHLGLWCLWYVLQLKEVQMRKLLDSGISDHSRVFVEFGLCSFRTVAEMLSASCAHVTCIDNLSKLTSQKVSCLLRRLPDMASIASHNAPDVKIEELSLDFTGIIFVKERFIAFVLHSLLRFVAEICPNYSWIRTDYIVGGSTGIGHNTEEGESLYRRMMRVLGDFKTNALNLIVATSVLEEGVDVKQCNCVVRFDFPITYSSFLQSRGRARRSDSVYYVFIEEDNPILSEALLDYAMIEELISDAIKVENPIDPNSSGNDSTTNDDSLLCDHIILPYKGPVGENGECAIIRASSAVARIHEYCCQLPSDVFTQLKPQFTEKHITEAGSSLDLYEITLVLPINCPVKEAIKSRLSPKYLAKMNVCMAAIKLLYERGELDGHLRPHRKVADVIDTLNLEELRKKTNAKSNSRFFRKSVAKALVECFPAPNEAAYVHVIKFKMLSKASAMAFHQLIDPERCSIEFGILTNCPLPKIPPFSLYTRIGEVEVTLDLEFTLRLSENELLKLTMFHKNLFHNILNIVKLKSLDAIKECSQDAVIVPVKNENKNYCIAWDQISKFEASQNFSHMLTLEERQRFIFNSQSYRHAVVVPCYRVDSRKPSVSDLYFVSRVRTSLNNNHTATDYMPTKQGCPRTTFVEHYKETYGLEIVNKNLPLLEAVQLPAWSWADMSSNMFCPSIPKKQKDHKVRPYDDDCKPLGITTIDLIPELCSVHPFSADYWNIMFCLPRILHRVNQLILADELRENLLQTAFNVIQTRPLDQFIWSPLSYCNPDVTQFLDYVYSVHSGGGVKFTISPDPDVDRSVVVSPNGIEECDISQMEVVASVTSDPCTSLCEQQQKFSATVSSIDEEEDTSFFSDKVRWCFSEVSKINSSRSRSSKHPRSSTDSSNADQAEDCPSISPVTNSVQDVKTPTKLQNFFDESVLPDTATDDEIKFGPNPGLLLQALSTAKCGDAFDLERLETMGDSFLKFTVSLYLFHEFQNNHEGVLTDLRMRRICNSTLSQLGIQKDIHNLIWAQRFDVEFNWLPFGFRQQDLLHIEDAGVIHEVTVEEADFEDQIERGQGHQITGDEVRFDSRFEQEVQPKSVADVIEALIGAYMISFGPAGANKFIGWLGLNVTPEAKYECPVDDPDSSLSILFEKRDFHTLEAQICYRFTNKAYLVAALTHPSYLNRVTDCYQRLEFLGDAALDYMITRHLYGNPRNYTPGELTQLRSSLVNNVVFAAHAVKCGLHKYMLHSSPYLAAATDRFAKFIEDQGNELDFQTELLHEDELLCDEIEELDVPKALGDLFESLAGAIYLDSSSSLDVVWRVYFPIMEKLIEKYCQDIPKNAVQALHERVAVEFAHEQLANKLWKATVRCPDFGDFSGCGRTKRTAERTASKRALKAIKSRQLK